MTLVDAGVATVALASDPAARAAQRPPPEHYPDTQGQEDHGESNHRKQLRFP